MDMKKILVFAAILMIAVTSLSIISASNSNTIVMGKITESSIEASNFVDSSLPTGPGMSSSASSKMVTFDYTINAEIDISNMSDADKNALSKAIDGGNCSLVINMTDSSGSISMETYAGIDSINIEGNSLFIKDSDSMTASHFSADSVKITGIGLNDKGKHFVTI